MGESTSGGVLLTGGSGYVGSLTAAALLRGTDALIVLPVRREHEPDQVAARIARELEAEGSAFDRAMASRLKIVDMPAPESLGELLPILDRHDVRRIIHCAGSVDYFNSPVLEAANVTLTERVVDLARARPIELLVYVSTAFSSGYIDRPVRESAHPEPERDPTEYTRTKRRAEWLIAESGVPFICLRPAILIGDSRTGHYFGKDYGLYQMWAAIERLLCGQWEPEFHVVAPPQPAYLLHQDAFQEALLGIWRDPTPGAFVNLISRLECCPDGRTLWNLWFENLFHPVRVHYYDAPSAVPIRDIPRRQRALMALATVNLEIASHRWRFETTTLDRMRADGLAFADATVESVWRCQEQFMAASGRIRAFRDSRPRDKAAMRAAS